MCLVCSRVAYYAGVTLILCIDWSKTTKYRVSLHSELFCELSSGTCSIIMVTLIAHCTYPQPVHLFHPPCNPVGTWYCSFALPMWVGGMFVVQHFRCNLAIENWVPQVEKCNAYYRVSPFAWTHLNQDWKQQLETPKGNQQLCNDLSADTVYTCTVDDEAMKYWYHLICPIVVAIRLRMSAGAYQHTVFIYFRTYRQFRSTSWPHKRAVMVKKTLVGLSRAVLVGLLLWIWWSTAPARVFLINFKDSAHDLLISDVIKIQKCAK